MKKRKINSMGMELDEWQHKSCIAHFGVGEDWATLYDIHSKKEGQGHATRLLVVTRDYYEKQGKVFGGSMALNKHMRRLYEKLGITEYK